MIEFKIAKMGVCRQRREGEKQFPIHKRIIRAYLRHSRAWLVYTFWQGRGSLAVHAKLKLSCSPIVTFVKDTTTTHGLNRMSFFNAIESSSLRAGAREFNRKGKIKPKNAKEDQMMIQIRSGGRGVCSFISRSRLRRTIGIYKLDL